MFSGTKRVFPSTYYVQDWCEPPGVSRERACLQLHLPLCPATLPAMLPASPHCTREKNDVSYFN